MRIPQLLFYNFGFFCLSLILMVGSISYGAPETTARIQGILLQAESMFRDTEKEIVELEGEVQIAFKEQHLSAKKATLNLRAKTVDAIGRVIVSTPQATIGGDRIIMDYESNTALIYNGYVQAGNVSFSGYLIKKTGDKDYITNDAKYTACTTCPEAWSFTGSSVRAELGGYAYIKNSVLRFAGVPVLWLPYLSVPLKSDRQTGLLTPEPEWSSSEGFSLGQSYFWAMSRSEDSTWTIKNYEFRGPKAMVEYRYKLGERSSGSFLGAYIQDRVFKNLENVNRFRPLTQQGGTLDRWLLKYEHFYELPEGFVHRAQFNNTSDLLYSNDFPLETQAALEPVLESRTSLTQNFHSWHWSLDASYYKNQLQFNPLSGNTNAVQRLPEIRIAKPQTKLLETDFMYQIDFNMVNFARSNFAYDDLNAAYTPNTTNDRKIVAQDPANPSNSNCDKPNWDTYPECVEKRDGRFDPGKDLIRTGQRLDFRPSISRPMRLNHIELLPKISYRETQYYFGAGDENTNVRRLVRADLSSRVTLNSVYGDLSQTRSTRVKHEIQPEIAFTTVPWLYQPSHPFFGSRLDSEQTPFFSQASLSNADLNGPYGIQYDYEDRLFNKKLITFGVTNKLTRKIWGDVSPSYMQFLTWRLAQSYDADQAEKRGSTQAWSDLSSDLTASFSNFSISQKTNYYPLQKVTNMDNTLTFFNALDEYISLKNTVTYIITPGDETVSEDLKKVFYSITMKKGFRFLDLIGKINYDNSPNQNRVTSWGYGAQIKLPGDCWYFTFLNYRPITKDELVYKIQFGFSWDGKQKPPLTEQVLSQMSL